MFYLKKWTLIWISIFSIILSCGLQFLEEFCHHDTRGLGLSHVLLLLWTEAWVTEAYVGFSTGRVLVQKGLCNHVSALVSTPVIKEPEYQWRRQISFMRVQFVGCCWTVFAGMAPNVWPSLSKWSLMNPFAADSVPKSWLSSLKLGWWLPWV